MRRAFCEARLDECRHPLRFFFVRQVAQVLERQAAGLQAQSVGALEMHGTGRLLLGIVDALP